MENLLAKIHIFFFLLFASLFCSISQLNALVGKCDFNSLANLSSYSCEVTTTGSSIFYSYEYRGSPNWDGISNGNFGANMPTHAIKTSTGYKIIHNNRVGFTYSGTIHYYDGASIGVQGPQGDVGPQGPQGEVGPQGATGSFLYNSGAIRGTFDTYQASYDLPQWNLVLHLSSPAEVSAVEDIEIVGTGMFILNSTSVNDPSDPRILLTVKNTASGTGVECGWYDVLIPSSLLQGSMYPQTNSDTITTRFEIHGCEGYKSSAPPVYMLQGQETPFIPPSSSGSYIAIIYKDSLTGATYVDFWNLLYLIILVGGMTSFFYGLYRLFKRALTGKWN